MYKMKIQNTASLVLYTNDIHQVGIFINFADLIFSY
jgi:hypothetical protein